MWKKILVVGTTTAAILGAGTAALAFTGSSSPTPAPTSSTSTATHAKTGKAGKARRDRDDLSRALHGSVTTKAGKGGTGYVTHDGIRGTVTAVSASSITVKAADGFTDTFVVSPTTVVHTKADGKSKGATGQISSVQDGDKVGVLGTGTTTLTATHVIDVTH